MPYAPVCSTAQCSKTMSRAQTAEIAAVKKNIGLVKRLALRWQRPIGMGKRQTFELQMLDRPSVLLPTRLTNCSNRGAMTMVSLGFWFGRGI